jgi:hypothetical protein
LGNFKLRTLCATQSAICGTYGEVPTVTPTAAPSWTAAQIVSFVLFGNENGPHVLDLGQRVVEPSGSKRASKIHDFMARVQLISRRRA